MLMCEIITFAVAGWQIQNFFWGLAAMDVDVMCFKELGFDIR